MSWSVKLTDDAKEDLNGLDNQVRERVKEKLKWFGDNFESLTPIALTGDYQGFYKFRVGDWRVFYIIDWEKKTLFITYIRHRSSSYK